MKKKRLLVFVYYDTDGIVDDYIKYYLDNIKQFVSRIIIVCNGLLNEKSTFIFNSFAQDVIIRNNTGFDVMAWKAGLEHVGWDEIPKYDEVILANDSVFGPIYPLCEMFEKMSNNEEIDFWGVTSYGDWNSEEYAQYNPFRFVPPHIQSYFVVYGKRLLTSGDFKCYWDDMPCIQSWTEAVGRHETYQTKYFEDLGYDWDVYARLEEKNAKSVDDIYYRPDILLKCCRLPFVKRNMFIYNRTHLSDGVNVIRAMDIVKKSTEYSERLIWKNILRRYNQYDIFNTLKLSFIVPSDYLYRNHDEEVTLKTVLIMHLDCSDLFKSAYKHAEMMPKDTDIFITTDDKKNVDELKYIFSTMSSRVSVRIIQSRDRSESTLLVGLADIISKYDLVCFWKEKKSKHLNPYTERSWIDRTNNCLLGSKEYADNIIKIFESNPCLGMLSPSPPHHASFLQLLEKDWIDGFNVVEKLADVLDLNISIMQDKPPIAPYGRAFWFRTTAMKKLFEYEWEHNVFSEELIEEDATLLHSIERIYSYICQDAGYYPAYVATEEYSQSDIIDLAYYLREYNKIIIERGYLFSNYLDSTAYFRNELSDRDATKDKLDTILLSKTWRYGRKIANTINKIIPKGMRKQ